MTTCGQSVLAGLKQGDSAAFTEIVEEHVDRLFSLAYGMLGNREDAEDACSEVFLRLARSAPRLAPDSCLPSYLYRLCVNRCLDVLRRRVRRPTPEPLSMDPPAESPGPPEIVADRVFRERVREALRSLSPQQRLAFLLRYFHARSVDEISCLLNCAPGTVKSHLSRAVARLRAHDSSPPPKLNNHKLRDLTMKLLRDSDCHGLSCSVWQSNDCSERSISVPSRQCLTDVSALQGRNIDTIHRDMLDGRIRSVEQKILRCRLTQGNRHPIP